MIHIGRREDFRRRGQVLPVFALMVTVLLGMAALAIDVSRKYSEIRYDRSAADAASLAGAQDLQTTTRAVTAAQQVAGRGHALDTLVAQVGASGRGSCSPNADIVNCALPGSRYLVSIKTPAPACGQQGTSTCDAFHSVQVTVRDPAFSTTFARILGQSTWDVGVTSVSGLAFASKYAVVTLQAPDPRNNGTDANLNKDMVVNGNNTVLNVISGDIGTNTSATTTNAGRITLADGYYIDHYDDLTSVGTTWSTVNGLPAGRKINTKIQDPAYMYPSFSGAPTFATQAAGVTPCTGPDFPTAYGTLLNTAVCYRPGIYTDNQGFRLLSNTDVAYLMPGAYSFPSGLTNHGSLLGGLISNRPGVVLVFPQSQTIDPNNAVNFILNAGDFGCSSDGCRASAAVDFANQQVKTTDGLVLTIEVRRDGNCFAGTDPFDDATSHGCNVNGNRTVGLAGSGTVQIGGVIYGPSDNMNINGNSSQTGFVGQIISWTVTYTGGSTLNQSYPGPQGPGILRVDPACSAPGEGQYPVGVCSP
jgi:Flp pilus assembly protein TadG